MFKKLFGSSQTEKDAHELYRAVVERARTPIFYQSPIGVEDSIEGRFELILLHLFLVDLFLSRVEGTVSLRRALREVLVKDMDRSLREMGIGDMSVGKQMKKVGAALLGRLASLEAASKSAKKDTKRAEMVNIFERNMNFSGENGAVGLADYTLQQIVELETRDIEGWDVTQFMFMSPQF